MDAILNLYKLKLIDKYEMANKATKVKRKRAPGPPAGETSRQGSGALVFTHNQAIFGYPLIVFHVAGSLFGGLFAF